MVMCACHNPNVQCERFNPNNGGTHNIDATLNKRTHNKHTSVVKILFSVAIWKLDI